MSAEQDWDVTSRAQFVALTTFRKTGAPVSAPVWIASEGDGMVLTSEASVGKVKRLRNDDHVTLQRCSRFGQVDPDAPLVHGRGAILGRPQLHPAATAALRRKYGLQYTVIVVVERAVRRFQRKDPSRLIIRITRA